MTKKLGRILAAGPAVGHNRWRAPTTFPCDWGDRQNSTSFRNRKSFRLKAGKIRGTVTDFGSWENIPPVHFPRLTPAERQESLASDFYVSHGEKKISAHSSTRKRVADTVGVTNSRARVATPCDAVRREPPERSIRVKEWLDRARRRFPCRWDPPVYQPVSRTDSKRFTERTTARMPEANPQFAFGVQPA